MRTNPRQHILETWRAFARVSMHAGTWVWGGGVSRNSITDAKQLLCLLLPATQVPGFGLDRPDGIEDDVLAALRPMGSGLDLPMQLVEALEHYLARFSENAGQPDFSSSAHLYAALPDDAARHDRNPCDLTWSYSVSITLCLAAKRFLRGFEQEVERVELRHRVAGVLSGIDGRLSAAMVGLLRSFTVTVFDSDSHGEQRLLRMVGQGRIVGRALVQELRDELRPVREKLPELTFGLSPEPLRMLLDYPERFFECGWTWGVVRDAPVIDLPAAAQSRQPTGVAEPRPLLPFTVGALEALTDLFSDRTAREGLLTHEQLVLREALSMRWSLVTQYWSTIATFGSGRWPVEDVPWEDAEGLASPFHSVLLVWTVGLGQASAGGSTADAVAARCADLLEELAHRGRVSRRALPGEPAINLHVPGVEIPMPGSESIGGPLTSYHDDYASMLAKTAFQVAGLATSRVTRSRLTEIGDVTVEHLLARRHQTSGLWDDPANIFPDLKPAPDAPRWGATASAMEVFVAAAALVADAPVTADPAHRDLAAAKIAEARHVLDQELLITPIAGGSPQLHRLLRDVDLRLSRAESLLAERPATASALADRALLDLDELSSARQAALWSR